MAATVTDFTEFLRPCREPTRFAIDEAVRAALDLVLPSYRHHGIATQVEASAGLWVRGFPNELTQVLLV